MPWLMLHLLALKTHVLNIAKKITSGRLRVGAIFVYSFLLLIVGSPVFAQATGASTTSQLNVDSILKFFADLAFNISAVLVKGIVLMIDIMVPVMTYNNFVGNPVVKAGWAIVRDTVNMFFVVILIIIAFGTIFGNKRFQWQQQVPRLLIMAVVINFSKTLCGIMIDFGQVIMLTFANALREIAAGNFIQLLGLNEIYSVSRTSAALKDIESDAATGASQAFDFFASGVMSVLLTLWVLGTLIILLAILIFRIIMLWILVVMAPLTWFLKGTEGIIQSNGYAEWWSEFKCLVGVGPILTFFLWLTLAVAGAGNIAANSGFTISADSNNADFSSSLLEPNHFLSFLIGMAMLFAGFKAATQFCSGISGQFISGAINKYAKQIPQITGRVLGGAGAAAGGVALKGGSLGIRAGAKGLAATPGVLAAGAKYVPGSAAASRAISRAREGVKTGAYGALERVGAATRIRPLERLGAKKKGEARDMEGQRRVEEVAKQKEGLKNMSRDTVANLAEKYAKNRPVGRAAEAEAMAVLDQAMTDSRLQKDLRASGALEELWKKYGDQFQKDYSHDGAKTAQVTDFKKANADITGSAHLINDYDDVKGLSDDALKDAGVQERLKKIKSDVKGEDGKTLTAYEAIEGAHLGVKKQSALGSEQGERFDRMGASELARVKVDDLVGTGSFDAMRRAIESAMRGGDSGRAKDIISQMSNQYTEEQDPKKRMDMLLALDETSAMLGASDASGAKGVLKHLNTSRNAAENLVPPQAPELAEGASAEAYVEQMKNASEFRKAGAVGALSNQEQATQQKVEQVEAQKAAVIGEHRGGIETELQALENSLAQARVKIDAELEKKSRDLGSQLQAAKAARDGAVLKKDKDDAQKEVDRLTPLFEQAKKNYTWPEDRAKAVEGDDRVKQIQVQIEAKAQQLQGMNPEDIAEVKALSAQIASLKTHIEEIGKARQGLS